MQHVSIHASVYTASGYVPVHFLPPPNADNLQNATKHRTQKRLAFPVSARFRDDVHLSPVTFANRALLSPVACLPKVSLKAS